MTKNKLIAYPAPMAVSKGHRIRRRLHNGEWWFSIVDVVAALMESPDMGARLK